MIQPEGYVHAAALQELAELVALGLNDIGQPCSLAVNALQPGTRTILVGCHLLSAEVRDKLPPDTIVLNAEQVHQDQSPFTAAVVDWARRFEVWDYSPLNVAALRAKGVERIGLLGIGHHPALTRIPRGTEDIDVLFYGSMNQRREAVLNGLVAADLEVHHLFGVYGGERDQWISRSRVVLNMHFYESRIFEVARVHYLLSNGRAVVGEVNPDTQIDPRYLGGFAAAPYDGLVDACVRLCRDDAARREQERSALATIAAMPQSAFMRALLA